MDQLQKVKEYYKELDKFYQHWGGNFQYPILKLSSWKYKIIYGEKG